MRNKNACILFFFLAMVCSQAHAQTGNFGVGTPTPEFKLSIDNDGGILAKGAFGNGLSLNTTGAGTRLIWYPKKAAFRVGTVEGNQWDDINTGNYSFAAGYNTTATGENSTAIGSGSSATADYATAIGIGTSASQTAALAIGVGSSAKGGSSTAIGYQATANGGWSIAMGYKAVTGVNGHYSCAIGTCVNANHVGSFVIGDDNSINTPQNHLNSTANNQFSARFDGGYRLFSNNAQTVGVSLGASGNSWSSISDSTKKENYQQPTTEQFLDKLSKLKLGSWNYKGQDPTAYRHYGPMAQEIFAAYGKDHYGTIGCDTTLASADMDGIIMIILQGLEKRSREQTTAVNNLEKENADLKMQLAELNELKAEMRKLSALAKRD